MSGICAIIHCDGKPASQAGLAPMLAALARRGPDGNRMAISGPAALGHALLATTPEALVETLPLVHQETGCTITADIRLDNRDDLFAALGLASEERVIGDGELVLCAYLRWGTECLDRLRGDFAFAVWDPRNQRLFCARDQVGMRQLIYYHIPGKVFALATDAEALLHLPDVPHRINAARIADFIEQMEAADLTSTFFEGVRRLPPAHALIFENGQLRQWRYWQLTAPPLLKRADDAAYAEAFLDVFTEAVRARLRSPDPVGSMLSGGMDSGSVTAIAARLSQKEGSLPLKTFSAIGTDPGCRETNAIMAALAIPHIDPQFVSLGEPDSFRDEVAKLTRESSEPFDGHMALIRAIYVAAQRGGVKVMLDGVGGDTTVTTGDMIAFQLGQWRVHRAWQEAQAQERFWSGELPAFKEFATAMKRALVPGWLRALRRPRWERIEAGRAQRESLISPELEVQLDMPTRRRANAKHLQIPHGCDPQTQALRMLHPYVIVARERYDRVAGALGIEPRDPFLDVRVLEFCLTLPVEKIHADGWPKLILRRAMEGLLPDSVRWKTGRDHLGWRFIEICDDQGSDPFGKMILSQLSVYLRPDWSVEGILPHFGEKGLVLGSDLNYLADWWNHIEGSFGLIGNDMIKGGNLLKAIYAQPRLIVYGGFSHLTAGGSGADSENMGMTSLMRRA